MKQCVDCKKSVTRPFSNGDKKIRCEDCAVKRYNSSLGAGIYDMVISKDITIITPIINQHFVSYKLTP